MSSACKECHLAGKGIDFVATSIVAEKDGRQPDAVATQQEQFSAVLAMIHTIPEGMRLASFPAHWEGPDCWCRPHIVDRPGEILVQHRDLHKGEFDS